MNARTFKPNAITAFITVLPFAIIFWVAVLFIVEAVCRHT